MKIAITGAVGPLGLRLADELTAAGHELRGPEAGVDGLDSVAVTAWCHGMDRIVHLPDVSRSRQNPDAGADAQADDSRILDTALKGTWNVLCAARDAGIGQVVQVSDVGIYAGYDDDHILSEDMVALPDTSAEQQAIHLAEGVAHEFARERPGSVLTLRLGRLVDAVTLPGDAAFDRDWLDLTDATAAIRRGLDLETYDHPSHWGLYNLVADTPFCRFALRIKQGRFAFSPTVDFRAWWPEQQQTRARRVTP